MMKKMFTLEEYFLSFEKMLNKYLKIYIHHVLEKYLTCINEMSHVYTENIQCVLKEVDMC